MAIEEVIKDFILHNSVNVINLVKTSGPKAIS